MVEVSGKIKQFAFIDNDLDEIKRKVGQWRNHGYKLACESVIFLLAVLGDKTSSECQRIGTRCVIA